MSDVDEEGLAETAAQCRARASRCTPPRVDVADREAVHAWADAGRARARARQPHLQQRRRGAGRHDRGDALRGLRVADGHQLLGRGARHQGVPAAPQGSRARATSSTSRACSGSSACRRRRAYNAAKFAVRGFTEALRQELEIEGAGVGVTSVHPGGIKTNIARSARDHRRARAGWTSGPRADFEKAFAHHAGARRPGHPPRPSSRIAGASSSAPTRCSST